MEDLKGKVVLVTGAARGMGLLHARTFASEGARVVLTDIDMEELGKAAEQLRNARCDAFAYELDIADREACFALCAKVESEVGPIDVLVNNAAIANNEGVLEMSEESYRRITDVNYLGQVWMMQALVPGMVRRGQGHVVNIASTAGKVGVARLGPYCATKHAMVGITDAVRQELKKSGVKFTIVCPGYIDTGMFAGAKVPFATRNLDPQRVADAVLEAVKKNKTEIYVPRFIARQTAFLRGLGLPRLYDAVSSLSGLDKSFNTMHKDRGRPF
jgi:NAD(P)-dependent dehydrogenase (short-subunit alcohol dehydrogenase family)